MKLLLLISAILAIFFSDCKRGSILSLNSTRQKQIIAFQPLDDYSGQEIDSVVKEISRFYNKQVIVLKPIEIPKTFFDTVVKQYSADSILNLLSLLQNDTLIEIVGLTYKPIFTIKDAKHRPYYDEKIFGLGYQPGNSCVVSYFKFSTPYVTIFNHRLKTVIIHEIGHNLGLGHCEDDKCIMSKNNGSVTNLDYYSGNDYCAKCRTTLNH
jgi:archaemetzincin